MIHIHLVHAAGVAKLLYGLDITILKAHANNNGAQLITAEPIPDTLVEHIESESDLGQFIFGVWVKVQEQYDET